MAPKRKGDDTESAPTFRDKKKVKIAEARSIQVQARTTASNVVAGSSTGVGTMNSMQGLPASIDVEKFAEARAFEINAMQEAMENAKGASTHRAWQELPRHLRRRAASHDVRRVPARLRDKARQEMDPVKKASTSKHISRPGKTKQVSRTESFLKRQRDKTWLETHIWHAKRMHMENKWGYRLATTPTEKSYRPSHRASVHGCILHDASYFGFIELKGAYKAISATLEAICDLRGDNPSAKRFTSGARVLETHMYKPGMYPLNLICPVTIMWRPLDAADLATASTIPKSLAEAPPLSLSGSKKQGKGKAAHEPAPQIPTAISADGIKRAVWVRVHPAAFDAVFSAIQLSASLSLVKLKTASEDANEQVKLYELELADLRRDFNIFEIMGPKASQVIKGALSPVQTEQTSEFRKFWSSLSQVQSAGSVPRGMVVGFKVYDPRLDFPPKNAKAQVPVARDSLPNLSSLNTPVPSDVLAQNSLWDEKCRRQLCKPKFKKKDIDARKSKNLTPGTALQPGRQDDRVPVILIQHSIEPADACFSTFGPRPSASRHGLHGWTLIIPAGWGMPFLSSLVYTGTRVGGLRERAVQAFEAGAPYFPRDYISTAAGAADAEERGNEDKEKWEKRPPAKRVNYQQRGIESPWVADWKRVLGLPTPCEEEKDTGAEEGNFVSAQRDDSTLSSAERGGDKVMDEPEVDSSSVNIKTIQPWLLRGNDIGSLVHDLCKAADPKAQLYINLQQARAKRGFVSLTGLADTLWQTALVKVRLDVCGRGKPVDHAQIFSLADDEWVRWKRALETHDDVDMGEGVLGVTALGEVAPQQSQLIGHVTTGNFSLSLGEGSAIGAVPLSEFVHLVQQTLRLDPTLRNANLPLVKVRDRDGLVCRLARLYLLQ